jgi:Domain of unknown function (DUF222)/HNH endonuclease
MKNSTLVGGEIFEFSPVEGLTTDIEHMSHDEVQQVVLVAKKLRDMADMQLLIATSVMHKMDSARVTDGLTTLGWLRRFCRMSASKASNTLKTAKALSHMDTVTKHAVAGEITTDSVRQLAMARDRHPDAFVVHEDVFADIATYLTPAELRRAINHWSQQVDHHNALANTMKRRARRGVYLSHTLEGMWDLKGTLDPETGHVINTAITSITDPTLIDPGDHRSHPQRRADAITDICRFWLDHNQTVTTSGGNRPHITVTVDYQTLIKGVSDNGLLPELDGTPVDPETIRRLTCDAGIVRIVADSTGQPLDVGRRVRTAPPALRRALEHRDGGCTWTGCTAPASWCDAHHIIHWADGGETTLANMALVCRKHHTMTHEGKTPPEP